MIESATTALPRSMWLADRLLYPLSVRQESLICVHGQRLCDKLINVGGLLFCIKYLND
jgi:hypothetical protein